MAIDTKPNFNSGKFEQCSGDIMNLSGCTQIYGIFDIESSATLTICDNAGVGKILTSNANGIATWQAGGITAISGGSGMNFSPITTTGEIILGTPSAILNTSIDVSSGTTHIHAFSASTFVTGTQGILVDGNNRFYLDDVYVTDSILPDLYSFSGITANQNLGSLPTGQTLGMVYITNTGTTAATVNLGTTALGNDITPFQPIDIDAGEDVSITVNMRLSLTGDTTIYINSDDWTNVGLNVQWANVTFKNVPLPTGGTLYTFSDGLTESGGLVTLGDTGITTNIDLRSISGDSISLKSCTTISSVCKEASIDIINQCCLRLSTTAVSGSSSGYICSCYNTNHQGNCINPFIYTEVASWSPTKNCETQMQLTSHDIYLNVADTDTGCYTYSQFDVNRVWFFSQNDGGGSTFCMTECNIHLTTQGCIDMTATKGGVVVPKMITANVPASPEDGTALYDFTTNKFCFRENGAWSGLSAAGGTGTTVGTLQQVTDCGSTTTNSINIGAGNTITGTLGLVQGCNNEVTGNTAHAEGWYNYAYGCASHAEGEFTKACGIGSHAEGYSTCAINNYSHTDGNGTVTSGTTLLYAGGCYNLSKDGNIYEIGAGGGSTTKCNAFEVYSNGNIALPEITGCTASNVLYYDTTDGMVSYGVAPSGGTGGTEVIQFAVSDETSALITGTSKITFRMPYAITLSEVRASVGTAPTGANLVVDINENGSTVLSTKLSIDAGEKTSTTAVTPSVISDANLADDAEITVDIDQIGSTVAGAGLKITLKGTAV